MEHYVAALAIDLAMSFTCLSRSHGGYFIGDELGEGRGVQIGALLQLGQLAMTSGGATIHPRRRPGASVFENVLR